MMADQYTTNNNNNNCNILTIDNTLINFDI